MKKEIKTWKEISSEIDEAVPLFADRIRLKVCVHSQFKELWESVVGEEFDFDETGDSIIDGFNVAIRNLHNQKREELKTLESKFWDVIN